MRGKRFLELYSQGKVLEEIGKLYSLTRERVRQILEKECSLEYHEAKKNRRAARFETRMCRKCRREFSVQKRSYAVFCSRDCFIATRVDEAELRTKSPRRCSKCLQVKSPSEFYGGYSKLKSGAPKLHAYCKSCHNLMTLSWSERNRDHVRETQRAYLKKYFKSSHYLNVVRPRQNARVRERYHTDPEFRARVLKSSRKFYHSRLGITPA